MAELTDRQIQWLRAELGVNVATTTLQERFDSVGTVRNTAVTLLRDRIQGWLAQPLSVTVSGVAGLNLSENVKVVERQIARLTALDDDPSDDGGQPGEAALPTMEVRRIARPRTRRRR